MAILIGLLAFREPLGVSPGYAALHAVALIAAVAAGLRLAAAQGRVAPEDHRTHTGPALRPPESLETVRGAGYRVRVE